MSFHLPSPALADSVVLVTSGLSPSGGKLRPSSYLRRSSKLEYVNKWKFKVSGHGKNKWDKKAGEFGHEMTEAEIVGKLRSRRISPGGE